MRVALLNPPSEKGYIRSGRWTRKTRARQNWPPIWLAYCHAYLEGQNHFCFLLDASVEDLNEIQTLSWLQELRPDYIVYYWCYDTYKQDLRFAEQCKTVAEVILVGPWSHCLPNALDHCEGINFLTYGEFEHTVGDVIKGVNPSKINGLIYRAGKEIHRNSPRSLCSSGELDRIPFVSEVYEGFLDFHNYHQTSLKFPFTDLQSSRGCPHRCSYCLQTRAMQGGSSHRTRSIKNVIEELWWIKNYLPQIKQIFFQDEAIIPKRAQELSQSILDEKLDICWGGLSRADLDYETLKLMESSGCRTLQVGFESPIQQILNIIHKDITVEQYEQFCHNISKTKIWNNAAFMIFPWMFGEDIKFTIQWAKRMKINRLSFIRAKAYPNTPYSEYLQKLESSYVEHKNELMGMVRNEIEVSESEKKGRLSKVCKVVDTLAGEKLMTDLEMERWEKWAHKQYYIYHPWMWKEILIHPKKWKDVFIEAKGLLNSFKE